MSESTSSGAVPAAAKTKTNSKPKPRPRPKAAASKVGTAVTTDVMAKIRKLRAKMELQSGARVTVSEAIGHAVSKALK